ncbi:hypothetical protein ACROYT_G025486 [Oculina patagonica]
MSLARKNSASHPDEMTVSEPENLEEGEGSHVQRSFGSIKRSVRKVPSEGLIVLSPEPGQVKFESADISKPGSSTDSTSVVRNGSAGHVERSLKLARKKEQLESEIPRRNSTGAEIIGKGACKFKHNISKNFTFKINSKFKHKIEHSKQGAEFCFSYAACTLIRWPTSALQISNDTLNSLASI